MCFHKHVLRWRSLSIKESSLHVESSTSRFFYFTRYSIITRFHSQLVLISNIFLGSKMTFSSSSRSGKIVWIGILSLITFFSKKYGKLGWLVKIQEASTCKTYYQTYTRFYKDHSTWVLIYCPYLVSWGTSVCKVATSKIPNPLHQNSFHYNVDLLIVSSCFLM